MDPIQVVVHGLGVSVMFIPVILYNFKIIYIQTTVRYKITKK